MELVTQYATPAVMMVLMTVVGLELTAADFGRVLIHPLPSLTGIIGALILLPAFGWSLVYFFDLPPAVAAGILLLAACPGGGLSNVMVFIAEANVALSVSLTAVHSILAVITLPFVASLGFHHLMGADHVFDVPTSDLVKTLVLTVLVPVGLGMAIRAQAPEWTERNARMLGRISLVLLLFLIIFSTRSQSQNLFTDFGPSTMWAVIWVVGSMSLALILGAIMRLRAQDTLAIAIEFGARNVALAITVAVGVFKDPQLAVFPSIVAAAAIPPALAVIFWYRWRHHKAAKQN